MIRSYNCYLALGNYFFNSIKGNSSRSKEDASLLWWNRVRNVHNAILMHLKMTRKSCCKLSALIALAMYANSLTYFAVSNIFANCDNFSNSFWPKAIILVMPLTPLEIIFINVTEKNLDSNIAILKRRQVGVDKCDRIVRIDVEFVYFLCHFIKYHKEVKHKILLLENPVVNCPHWLLWQCTPTVWPILQCPTFLPTAITFPTASDPKQLFLWCL